MPVILVALLLVGYLALVRRARRQGNTWPWWRTAVFAVLGLGSVVGATIALDGLEHRHLWAVSVSMVLLLSICPVLIALGDPIGLARQALGPRGNARLQRTLEGPVVRAVTFPITAALLASAVLGIVFFSPILGAAVRHGWAMDATDLVLLVVVLWLVSHPRVGGKLTGSGRFQEFAGAVHLGAARFRRHPRAAVGVLVAAFGYQLLVVLAAFSAARAVDLDQLGITACLAFIPAVAMAQTLPISLGGLGIREGALVLFLHPLGVSNGRAIAIGLLVYGLNLLVSLLGAPSFALGGRRAKVAA